jgi:hypothetical protein
MPNELPQKPKKPRVSYAEDAETIRISVQCTADSHADRPWLIDSFYLDVPEGGQSAMWLGSTTYWRDGRSVAQLEIDRSRATLVEDRVVSRDEMRSNPFVLDSGSRSRYSFRCKICGLSLARKSEAITNCFDRLAKAGVTEISLSGLISITK